MSLIIKNRLFSNRVKVLFVLQSSLLLFACGGGGSSSSNTPTTSPTPPVTPQPPTPPTTTPITANEAQRFLTKASFGATPADIERVIALGYEGWIDEQLKMPKMDYLAFHDAAIDKRTAARRQRLLDEGETDPAILDKSIGASQRVVTRLDTWWHGAINGKDQLRQRMAFALSQIFVVGDGNGDTAAKSRGYTNYYDLLAEHSFGNYKDLIKNVTINPIMANFLSLRGSIRFGRNGVTGLPDENYARESLQLFSIGLVELNLDGTPKLVNGQEIETYDQELIGNFARIYTGWNFQTGRVRPGWEAEPLEPWGEEPNTFHDYDEKVLFNNKVVPAGLSTPEDLEAAMDSIFNHPNVAPFISKQLIQRFVTSNPSPAYVKRIATIFNDNGNGVRGDFSAVIKAILLDDESINSHKNLQGGKLKEPLLRISQIWRAFDAQSPIEYIRFTLTSRSLGQRPLGSPSVFNFYEPNFAPSGAIEDAGLVAPEFKLLKDGLNIAYLNKLAEIAKSKEFGDPNPLYTGSFALPMKLNLDTAKQLSSNLEAMLDYYDDALFGGLMSAQLRSTMMSYLAALPEPRDETKRAEIIAEEALLLLSASPEFSVQR